MKKKNTLSLCMIVKDEEEVLERCLNSVKDIVDEFCILDTGSTDSTTKIIEKYGDLNITKFVNFVDTKNKSIEYATGDYILWMDADEILTEGLDKLKEYVNSGKDIVVSSKMKSGYSYFKPRLWKKDSNIFWDGPNTHEFLNFENSNKGMINDNSIIIEEFAKSDKDFQYKYLRDINILNDYISNNGETPRALFYLAQSYRDLGLNTKAIETYDRYINLPETYFIDEIFWASYMKSVCYKANGEIEKAISNAKELEINFPDRAEPTNFIGIHEYENSNWEAAKVKFERLLELDEPTNIIGISESYLYDDKYAKDYLSLIYLKNMNYKKSIEFSKELVENYRDDEVDGDRYVNNLNFMLNDIFNKKFVFYLPYIKDTFKPGMLNNQGLGGVESTYHYLPKELASMGAEVYVFTTVDNNYTEEGVNFIHWEEYYSNIYSINPDILISSREFNIFNDGNVNAIKVMWLQDMYPFRNSHINDYKYDYIVTSTPYHNNYLKSLFKHDVDPDKFKVIPIDVDRKLYDFELPEKREKNKIIYSSSPDRGLFNLFEMWPKIKEEVPDASLHFYYGLDSMKMYANGDYYNEHKEKIDKALNELPDVYNHGRLSKGDLIEEMKSASLSVYPTHFIETFCLTAYETALCGLPMVTVNRGALSFTAKLNEGHIVRDDIWFELDGDNEYAINKLSDVVINELKNNFDSNNIHKNSKLLRDEFKEDGYFKNWNDISYKWLELIGEHNKNVKREVITYTPPLNKNFTHNPVLSIAASILNGNSKIVEFGMGYYSSFNLKVFTETYGHKLYSFESDVNWLNNFKSYESDNWKMDVLNFQNLQSRIEFSKDSNLVFVDNGFLKEKNNYRNYIVNELINNVDYVVAHDTEKESFHNYGYDFSNIKYKKFMTIDGIETAILSNKHNLDFLKF